MKSRVEDSGVHIRQTRVDSIETKDSRISGIRDRIGIMYHAKAVIVTAGTFLSGLIHIGKVHIPAGRAGEEGAYELAESLKTLGFFHGRLKTGTPPRLHRDTIDLSALQGMTLKRAACLWFRIFGKPSPSGFVLSHKDHPPNP